MAPSKKLPSNLWRGLKKSLNQSYLDVKSQVEQKSVPVPDLTFSSLPDKNQGFYHSDGVLDQFLGFYVQLTVNLTWHMMVREK